MNRRYSPPWRTLGLIGCAIAVALLGTVSAFAQSAQFGNVFGTVVDNQGAALPGVTVTLTGIGAARVFVTDTDGSFRFPSLSPGGYMIKAELEGFGVVSRSNVAVNIGRNTEASLTLSPALEQTITVTAETPLLDVRKTGTGATVTKVELEQVPTARDPWVILQQVPGVLTDRINVGGNESGQQSQFVGKGASGDQSTFNVDGVNITDMSAVGSSPAYYDFDSFEEIQVTTGGTDPRIQTPGVQLNMVYKRGSNELRGSGRYFLTDGEWQAAGDPDAEGSVYLEKTNEIEKIDDYGLELGGPILRDRLWAWGAYANQQIDLFVSQPAGQAVRFSDKTTLETINFKLNGQITSNNSAVGLYTDSGKVKIGRNAAPTRPPDTTFNQDSFGPAGAWKVEDTHIFSSNFYLTGMYSKTNGGFQLVPNSGKNCQDFACISAPDVHNAVLDANSGVWANSFYFAFIERPQEQYRADGSTFFDTGAMNHELKAGLGYREVAQRTNSGWPGGQYFVDYSNLSGYDPGFGGATFFRSAASNTTGKYTDIYVGDTILMGNLTIQAGLRFDIQKGSTGALTAQANPDIPLLLPAASLTVDETIEWNSISPRLGATYTLGSARRTVLRGSYNRYVDQLSTGLAASVNPLSFYQYLYFYGVQDLNGDQHITAGEIGDGYIYATYNLDPLDYTTAKQLLRFDNDIKAPTTDEIIAGVEHELLPEFTLGVVYTHRAINDILWTRYEKTAGAGDFYTSADYHLSRNAVGTLPNGQAFSEPFYVLNDGLNTPVFGVVQNRPGYGQTYDGLELTAVKRMSNRWMMRGNLSWNDWKQDVSPESIVDPTRLRTNYGCSNCDGEIVVQGSGTGSGSKGQVFINSGWSYNFTGVFQAPFGINLGASVLGREGYPIPYVSRVNTGPNTAGGEGFKQILIADSIDQFRLDDIFELDLRLAKEFRFSGVGLTLSVDAFNVTNERTIMQRNTRLYTTATRANAAGNRISEYQSPQVLRAGARITF